MATLETTPEGLLKILTRNAQAKIFTMAKGSPSTAKSAIGREFARQHNLFFIDIRLAQSDPTDLNGFPKLYAQSMSVNPDETREYAAYVPFETFPTDSAEIPEGFDGWFLFFDELNSADRGVAKAAYKIILDRCVGQFKLHDRVVMAGAGNLDTDGALTEEQGTALQSRMCNVKVGIDKIGFRNKTEEWGWDRRISSFLHFKPEMAHAFDPNSAGNEENYPCYRTWEFTNELIKVIPENEFGDHESLVAMAGNLGEGCAREFLAFCKYEDKLPKISVIRRAPDTTEVPKESGHLFALTGSIASHVDEDSIDALMTYTRRLPMEFQVITLRQMIRRDRTLQRSSAVKAWISSNGQELF